MPDFSFREPPYQHPRQTADVNPPASHSRMTTPEDCGYQASSKSQPCGTRLFKSNALLGSLKAQIFVEPQPKKKHTHQGLLQLSGQRQPRIPISTFVTQNITEWLKWFLSLPMVEEYIDQWENELEVHNSNSNCDMAQGSVWKNLFSSDYKGLELCLGLSLFINWFNPLKNKLAGWQLSMGIISLNCLNLPPHLQYQTLYTCLAGIIPSPNQPTMITINNILTPLVNELYELNKGLTILTPKYPHGWKVVVKLVTLVGNIVAVHKVAGFKSHSATKFCSWCEINASDRHKLEVGHPCKGRNVLEAAHHWKDMKSAFSREKVAMRTGVRWSEFNSLPYWDPVCNIALGVMHNWFKCVFQHHFTSQWGFDSKISDTYENYEALEPLQKLKEEDTKMSIDKELTLESDNENSGFL
ncbi:hypothetical protein O181_042563 [Austropuccinia psidii MF-1]|uniref:Uncharacterized protein n=1 Tax=Austropuccinia psidii MF-1 TaxID=1389203 RepID=A0A9Q3DJM6_9BASI|nr:hypothetical protein [Austropuccinia psidii MF-1]